MDPREIGQLIPIATLCWRCLAVGSFLGTQCSGQDKQADGWSGSLVRASFVSSLNPGFRARNLGFNHVSGHHLR